MEIHKPSVLTQVVFTKQVKKNIELYEMNSIQIDLVNVILYQLWQMIRLNKINFNLDEDSNIASTFMELNLKDITTFIGKYNRNQYKDFMYQLEELSNIKMVVNSLNKNKDEEMRITRFIGDIVYSKKNGKKTIKVAISNYIAQRYMNNKSYFSKMFLKIQFSLKSKYSKLLYELMKDYEGISKTIELESIYDLLNVTEQKQRNWSIFRANILDKSIKEINTMTDIEVSYTTIKTIPNEGRLQVTALTFNSISQNLDRLVDLKIEQPIEEQIKFNKKKAIALIRLEQSKKFTEINNEEAWLKKTIESITDEFIEQQDLIEEAKEKLDELDSEMLKIFGKLLMDEYKDVVTIKDYKLQFVFDESKSPITNTAKETYDILLELENN